MFRHRSGPDYSNAPIAMARRHPNVLEKPGDITGREYSDKDTLESPGTLNAPRTKLWVFLVAPRPYQRYHPYKLVMETQ